MRIRCLVDTPTHHVTTLLILSIGLWAGLFGTMFAEHNPAETGLFSRKPFTCPLCMGTWIGVAFAVIAAAFGIAPWWTCLVTIPVVGALSAQYISVKLRI